MYNLNRDLCRISGPNWNDKAHHAELNIRIISRRYCFVNIACSLCSILSENLKILLKIELITQSIDLLQRRIVSKFLRVLSGSKLSQRPAISPANGAPHLSGFCFELSDRIKHKRLLYVAYRSVITAVNIKVSLLSYKNTLVKPFFYKFLSLNNLEMMYFSVKHHFRVLNELIITF